MSRKAKKLITTGLVSLVILAVVGVLTINVIASLLNRETRPAHFERAGYPKRYLTSRRTASPTSG